MLHVRHNLITADPALLGDSVKFMENEVRPAVEGQPGNLGLSLQVNPELGLAILESFWVSGDALRASEHAVALNRAAAVRRAAGTVTVERYAVPVFELEAPLRSGEGVRVTRMDVAPSAVEDTIEVIGDTAVPRLADTEGSAARCSSSTGPQGTPSSRRRGGIRRRWQAAAARPPRSGWTRCWPPTA